jgi:hypothetical protein
MRSHRFPSGRCIGAAVLAFGHNLDLHLLTQMLQDAQAENFHLDERCFRWKEYAADAMMTFAA